MAGIGGAVGKLRLGLLPAAVAMRPILDTFTRTSATIAGMNSLFA